MISAYTYSRLYNLSTYALARYVIARKRMGFKEAIPDIYKWLLAQVGDVIKPRLKPCSPYYKWTKLYYYFKHSGITSFKTSDIMQKAFQMRHILNLVTSEQPDKLKTGLSYPRKVDNWNKYWNFIEITNIL